MKQKTKKNNNLILFMNNILLYIIILLNLLSFSLNEEKTQNIECSSVPFCKRLMFYNEDQKPLFFLDNKTNINIR